MSSILLLPRVRKLQDAYSGLIVYYFCMYSNGRIYLDYQKIKGGGAAKWAQLAPDYYLRYFGNDCACYSYSKIMNFLLFQYSWLLSRTTQ
jgi:hypothetical protein